MKFQSEEDLQRIAADLAEADFERADCSWEENGLFTLESSRPASKGKPGGLFRKEAAKWVRCQLTVRHVTRLSISEEFDVKPPLGPLLELSKMTGGFSIHLRSAHGLRITLQVSKLSGELNDLA
jgi:hypothetical protein